MAKIPLGKETAIDEGTQEDVEARRQQTVRGEAAAANEQKE